MWVHPQISIFHASARALPTQFCFERAAIYSAVSKKYVTAYHKPTPRYMIPPSTEEEEGLVLGHKLEYIYGSRNRSARDIRSKYPLHPVYDADLKLRELVKFQDLQLRWGRYHKRQMRPKRKWHRPMVVTPFPEPTSVLYWHDLGRARDALAVAQNNTSSLLRNETLSAQGEKIVSLDSEEFRQDSLTGAAKLMAKESDTPEALGAKRAIEESFRRESSYKLEDLSPLRASLNPKDMFCVFKSNSKSQHKVSVGDLVKCAASHRKHTNAGDKIEFGTVLLVGTPCWTIIGKPVVPHARVHATVEQCTLSQEVIYSMWKCSRGTKFKRVRAWLMVLHIDEIVIETETDTQQKPFKPLRLLDLWSNRLLDWDERRAVPRMSDGVTPVVEEIYDGSENIPGIHAYKVPIPGPRRFIPDPLAVPYGRIYHKTQ